MRTPAVPDVRMSEEGVYISLAYDGEWGMLASFAEAILQHARCVHCNAPPPIDFATCPCDRSGSAGRKRRWRFSFNHRIDHAAWKNTVEPLGRKDLRRAHTRNCYEVRRESIQYSGEAPYSAGDAAWLRKVQNDCCYHCGASIAG